MYKNERLGTGHSREAHAKVQLFSDQSTNSLVLVLVWLVAGGQVARDVSSAQLHCLLELDDM